MKVDKGKKMNKTKKIVFGIGILLAVLAVLTSPAAADSVVYFAPDPSTVSVAPGENVTIQIWADIGNIDPTEDGIECWQIGVDFDPTVVNISNVSNPWIYPPYVTWWMDWFGWDNPSDEDPGPIGAWVWITGAHTTCYGAPTTVQIANLTIEGVSGGTSPLNFTRGVRLVPTRGDSRPINCSGWIIEPTAWVNGTIECTGVEETFTKALVEGWNLLSLPLTPSDNSTSSVLSSMSGKYDAVFKYDATSKQFEDVTTGTVDPGIGYFVNVTTAGTWSYGGQPYNSMSIELKQGLNMVGWLNCSKDIVSESALSSIDGNYYYVARWNAATHEFETYNPVAPEVFNDFTMMDRGEGYFISAKGVDMLTESCSG